jgi:hypothetical protein
MKTSGLALLAVLAFIVTPAVDAQPDSAYFGVSIGELAYSEDVFSEQFSDSVGAWHLAVGYRFFKHVAVEGAYGQSEAIRNTATFRGQVFPGQQGSFESELDKILKVRLLGVVPFEDAGVSLLAGLGFADVDQEIEFAVNGVTRVSGERSDNRQTLYLAVQYDWSRVALRLGYEKHLFDSHVAGGTTGLSFGDVDVTETSLSFFYEL